MMKLYEINEELVAIQSLIDGALDENGEPRELTAEETEIIKKFFEENAEHLEDKADSYGKIIANYKLQAETAESEKKNFKAEIDRLSNRAKVFANRQEALKNNLFYAMNLANKDKIKTALFSFNVQNKPMAINIEEADVDSIPDVFLKKEISKSAISYAIKSGEITVTDSGSLIWNKTGELLEGVKAIRDKTLVIR